MTSITSTQSVAKIIHPLIAELRTARKQSVLSQQELADLVGITVHAVSKLEAGVGSVDCPSSDHLAQIAV